MDDHLKTLVASLSPVWAEVESMRNRGCETDLFCGLFADDTETATFRIGKWAWIELVQKKLKLILDLYPPSRGGEEPKRSSAELVAQGIAIQSTLPAELSPAEHVEQVAGGALSIASPDALRSVRISCRFASTHGQGSLELDEPLVAILAEVGADLQVILCDAGP